MAPNQTHRRLDPGVRPHRVTVQIEVDPSRSSVFRGEISHEIELDRSRRVIRLHAVDLRVTRPRIEVGGRTHRGRLTALEDAEMIEIHFEKPIPAGTAKLRLGFSGRLRTDLCGLYAASVGDRRYAFSQLEAAEARKFFPCFDEPIMKARFTIEVTTGAANTVLSNAPVRKTQRHADGRKTFFFAQTPPLSTYLIALAVGELEASKPTSLGPTQIRIWHTPGKRRLTHFGLEAARECLQRLEDYFGTPYPYAKLDLVAVPDFEFGAMENAGAVFFRETLLLIDKKTATLSEKKRAAEVICHELAHMWYGDLVTMAWWDDLWLNEAFATWMSYAIVDDWKPEWKMWLDFQHGTAAALAVDALRHTHPIYCQVRKPSDVNENFDHITYEKGAAVVRMIERYLGTATFRRGVRAYMREHRESNTVAADLWNALSKASGEDVEQLVRPWIEQEGYPVIKIRRVKVGQRLALELRQQRFVEQPIPKRTGTRRKTTRWPIPWVGRIGGSRRGGRGRLERHLFRGAVSRVPLKGVPRFVYGNADEGGFFRPLHDATEIRQLAGSLNSLSTVERMGLIDHQWALVRSGRAGIGSILDLVEGFPDETDADVLETLRRPLGFIARSLIPEAAPHCEEPFRNWLRDLFEAPFDELGWKPAAREPDAIRLRRAALLAIAGGIAEAPTIVEAAAAHCHRYLSDRRAIEANLANSVVSLGARGGDKALHQRFLDAMAAASTPQERSRFLLALSEFRNPKLIDKTLALTTTKTVPIQDVVFVLVRLLANPAAKEQTWSFVMNRWDRLQKRIPPQLASRLIDTTPSLLTDSHRREVARFFREHPLPNGERALRQALERFAWYKGFRRKAAADLIRWAGI